MKEIHDFSFLALHRHGEHYFTLVLRHSHLSPMPPVAPGQFVEVRVDGEPSVMLRRPISVHDVDPDAGTLSLLVQVVGKGTRRLSQLTEGDTAELIPVRDEFRPYGTVCLSTDDGSLGHKGLVIENPAFAEQYDIIYTCGPTPMMKAVARSAAERGIRCEVSLENMMACGVGACLCCVTDTDQGHRCVCKDGPVFDITSMKKWYENK